MSAVSTKGDAESDTHTIHSLLLKLKGNCAAKNGTSDVSKINSICETFIYKLKQSGVDIETYNINLGLKTDSINIAGKHISVKGSKKEEMEKKEELDPELCTICFTPLDELSIELKCGHKFHYECAIEWYKELSVNIGSHASNKIPRTCTYCRLDGGYLELHAGEAYISGIHDPKFKNSVVKSSVEDVSKPQLLDDGVRCMKLTKKGKQCKKNRIYGTETCHLHLPNYSTKS